MMDPEAPPLAATGAAEVVAVGTAEGPIGWADEEATGLGGRGEEGPGCGRDDGAFAAAAVGGAYETGAAMKLAAVGLCAEEFDPALGQISFALGRMEQIFKRARKKEITCRCLESVLLLWGEVALQA